MNWKNRKRRVNTIIKKYGYFPPILLTILQKYLFSSYPPVADELRQVLNDSVKVVNFSSNVSNKTKS